ncbi:MAG: glycosyltransferase [Rickettsiales bacterium]|jgi:glycosyltransferase involved in cell wall biosynthesis|nr:glycosyltransferase [Rickettsiales bacterium]
MKNVLVIASSLESGTVDQSVIDVAMVLHARGFDMTVVSAGGRMVKNLKRFGIKHVLMPIDYTDVFVIHRNLKRLREIVEAEKIGLVHSFTPQASYYAAKIRRFARIPYVFSLLTVYRPTILSRLFRRASYMARADYKIVPSEYAAGYVQSAYRVPPGRIVIIPQWVDTDMFNTASVSAERIIKAAGDLRIPEDCFIVMTAGRLSDSDGQDALIEAVARLPRDVRERMHCLLVGDYRDAPKAKDRLERLASKLGVSDIIHIAGAYPDLAALMTLCDVFVATNTVPRLADRNVLRAQSMGRPVIAPDIGSTREYMADQNGFRLYAPGDAGALADGIMWGVSLPKDKRSDISHRMASVVRLNFSLRAVPAKIGDIYDYILESRG